MSTIDELMQMQKVVAKSTTDSRFSLRKRMDMCVMNGLKLIKKCLKTGKIPKNELKKELLVRNFNVNLNYVLIIKQMLISLFTCIIRPTMIVPHLFMFNSMHLINYYYQLKFLQDKRQLNPAEVLVLTFTASAAFALAFKLDSPIIQAVIYACCFAVLDACYRLFDYLYRKGVQ
ncbi:Hypothetical_protein [Hexamita inflata]|uniref:Hypothetical_protein n=1 Tax=Hexamita inflata TaxID=28002 RepID=A0ABP1H9Q1_9EUKA